MLVGNVMICVGYLMLNYKDGLVIIGKSLVVCKFLMVLGIDLVGEVEVSMYLDYCLGDWVVFNGWGVGEMYWGGFV